MFWVFIAIAVVGLLVFLGSLLYILGARLPEEHVAEVRLWLGQPPETVWAVLADFGGHAAWSPGVTKLERLEDAQGRESWRQHMGRNSFVLVRTRSEPPRVLEGTIEDDHKMFSGRWLYDIAPDGHGSTVVTLTEHGRVPQKIPRAMMHYIMGETLYIKKHLRGLAQKFGETPRLEEGRPDGHGHAAAAG